MVKRETVFDNDYITLWYYPTTKIVHHQCHRFAYGQAFREALTAGLEMLQQHGAQKWLSDDRMQGPLTQADQEWSQNEWRVQALSAGWKYWALLLPTSMVGQSSIKRIIKDAHTDTGITIEFFEQPEDALQWLENR